MMYSWTIKSFVYSSFLLSLTALYSQQIYYVLFSCPQNQPGFSLCAAMAPAVTILLGKGFLSYTEDFLFCKFPVLSYPAETHWMNLPLFLLPVQQSEHLSLTVPSKLLFMLV